MRAPLHRRCRDVYKRQALRYLPRLFGGEEVFEKAYALFDENGARESLDYLRSIYDYLRQLGLEDLSLIHI